MRPSRREGQQSSKYRPQPPCAPNPETTGLAEIKCPHCPVEITQKLALSPGLEQPDTEPIGQSTDMAMRRVDERRALVYDHRSESRVQSAATHARLGLQQLNRFQTGVDEAHRRRKT